MSHRPAVPQDQIKVQYREPLSVGQGHAGRFALDAPGYEPFVYTVDARTGHVNDVVNRPDGMQLLRRNQLQSTMNNVINPYPTFDTLTYIDRTTQERQFLPLTPLMNRTIMQAANEQGGALRGLAGFDRSAGTRELDPRVSDALIPLGGHRFAVKDMDTNTQYDMQPVPHLQGARDHNRTPRGGRE